ncbi:antitoxin [Oscillibacter valericigenes]|nr:antitoxin [Oscillibacter valericigenes]MCF2617947.1 antitoxin [Oscillibacter valericigenes]
MTLALKLLCRVVKRRVRAGEGLETVLADYPKLTETERQAVVEMVMEK